MIGGKSSGAYYSQLLEVNLLDHVIVDQWLEIKLLKFFIFYQWLKVNDIWFLAIVGQWLKVILELIIFDQ